MSDQTTIEQLRNALMLAILTIDCERRGLMPDGHVRARLVRVLNDSEPALSASGAGVDPSTTHGPFCAADCACGQGNGPTIKEVSGCLDFPAGVDYPPSPEAFLQQRQPSTHHADVRAYTYAEVLDVMHAYALTVRTAGVDPSKDLATAFAEKFPQQDLPADAATVFRENYRALLNEEPPAGVDHLPSIIQEMRTLQTQVTEWQEHGEIGRLLTLADDLSTRLETWADQLAGVDRQAPQPCDTSTDTLGRCVGCNNLRDFELADDIKTCIALNIRLHTTMIETFGCTLFEAKTEGAGVGVAPPQAER